jgi:hypothetical protein
MCFNRSIAMLRLIVRFQRLLESHHPSAGEPDMAEHAAHSAMSHTPLLGRRIAVTRAAHPCAGVS